MGTVIRIRLALIAVGAALSAVVLASCSHPAGTSDQPGAPASSPRAGGPVATSDHPVPAGLQGTWLVRRSRAQMRADLTSYGLGRYADAFFDSEKLGRRATLAVTYTDNSFSIAWRRDDGTWYVGWYGAAHADRGVLTMTDSLSHADDSYGWRVTPHRLTLRFRRTTTADQHGIPFEAYSRAYFTRPLRPANCTPADLDACLAR